MAPGCPTPGHIAPKSHGSAENSGAVWVGSFLRGSCWGGPQGAGTSHSPGRRTTASLLTAQPPGINSTLSQLNPPRPTAWPIPSPADQGATRPASGPKGLRLPQGCCRIWVSNLRKGLLSPFLPSFLQPCSQEGRWKVGCLCWSCRPEARLRWMPCVQRQVGPPRGWGEQQAAELRQGASSSAVLYYQCPKWGERSWAHCHEEVTAEGFHPD